MGTHLLASSDIMEKNRNPLACLRNAGSYFAESYCRKAMTEKVSVPTDIISSSSKTAKRHSDINGEGAGRWGM
jgi:hypothetical protein